jgi:hypothetical protein
LENSSKHWKKVRKLRREYSSRQIDGRKRSGLLGFYVQEGEGGAHRKKDGSALSDQIKIPVSHWIGRESRVV